MLRALSWRCARTATLESRVGPARRRGGVHPLTLTIAQGGEWARESRRAKREVCSPPAVACGSVAAGIAQFVQQLFCRDQIAGVETLREAVVDRLETGDGIGRTALIS